MEEWTGAEGWSAKFAEPEPVFDVLKVKEDSPLKGHVEEGWELVTLDGIDVSCVDKDQVVELLKQLRPLLLQRFDAHLRERAEASPSPVQLWRAEEEEHLVHQSRPRRRRLACGLLVSRRLR